MEFDENWRGRPACYSIDATLLTLQSLLVALLTGLADIKWRFKITVGNFNHD